MTDSEKTAELLFPNIDKTTDFYESLYPLRQLPEGARVTRFAPSPTGFLHIGGLFAALVAKLTADVSGGVFYLRIEDTDKKREVENGVQGIIEGLSSFGIDISEGVTGSDTEIGDYGPYTQSKRENIYKCFAKKLVSEGLAYPCFCTEEELSELRVTQENKNANPGYYGKYAKCRNLTYDEILSKINAGLPYALRLKSNGDENKKIIFDDCIKGKIEMPENIMDIVLLKTDGIPTYHFAHCIDDHLMRTTHVVRGDEWISSVPVHIQLFKMCGFKVPKYAHISPIMKEDNGGKRKLSKRKDPEASVSFYTEQGYPKESVLEYLYTLANSNFEDFRRANKDAKLSEFPFNLKKMSVSGALFDMNKLNDISKNVISQMTADTVLDYCLAWAKTYDRQLYSLLSSNREYALSVLSIDRGVKNPRKDIEKWTDTKNYLCYFYDELYVPCFDLPENIQKSDAADILSEYIKVFDCKDEKDTWFEKIKELCYPLGFTPNVKEYKADRESFKGHVGDVSTVIRIAVTGRTNTPDLHAVMQLLGDERVLKRLGEMKKYLEEE